MSATVSRRWRPEGGSDAGAAREDAGTDLRGAAREDEGAPMGAAPEPPDASMFRSLRVPNFRLFAGGQVVSLIGTWMAFIALDWLVLDLTGDSGTALGLVTACQFAPLLLLTLYAGVLADRFDKRRLLVLANSAAAALSLGLSVLVLTGGVQLWHVYVFAAGLGATSALEVPTRQSFVSELVGRTELPNALSLQSATFNLARIIGPALAGLLIAVGGTGPAFAVNALSYVATVVATVSMDPRALHPAPRPDSAPQLSDGLRYVGRRLDLLMPVVLVLVIGMVGFNFPITLALLSKEVYDTGPRAFGVLSAALAAGALLGALTGARRTGRPGAAVVLVAAAAFGGLEILVGLAPSYLWTAVLLVPTGAASIWFAQSANQRVQLGTESGLRGRVMAVYILVFLGTTPLGAPLTGWVSEQIGPRSAVALGGALSLVAAGAAALVRHRHLRHHRHRGRRSRRTTTSSSTARNQRVIPTAL